jgi:predicted nucleic acid-binding protein
MSLNIRRTVLVDTGFWFALYDARDKQLHAVASTKASMIQRLQVVFPWPVLYEALNTRFVKNSIGMLAIEALVKSPRAILIDDKTYRTGALDATLREFRNRSRALSLVDMVIRFILDDPNIKIDGLLTFNEEDFADICRKRRIQIL